MTAPAVVEGLSFTYSGATTAALSGIDLTVPAAAVTLIEGPSGGGKSTLLRALTGSVPHFHGGHISGRVTVAGLDTRTAAPAAIARLAGLVFQDPEAQAVMGGVDRDIAFGLENGACPPGEIDRRIDGALAAVGAGHLRGRSIAALSGGERQRVAIASVIACRPALLVLDEPTSQLDDDGAHQLALLLRRFAADGGAVVIAEHRAERVAALADHRVQIAGGRVVGGEPSHGETPAGASPPRVAAPGPVRLALEDLSLGYGGRAQLRQVALTLAAGTITALRGPNGAGKTLLARTAVGLTAAHAGRILVDGRDVTAVPAERRFPAIALVPQDPGRHLLTERVSDEVAQALINLGVSGAERERRVAAALARFDLTRLAEHHPLDLSVGERERVALAALLVAEPGVVILDEPTRGMDPARKRALAAELVRLAAGGAAVLLITHDSPFAASVADRTVAIGEIARPA